MCLGEVWIYVVVAPSGTYRYVPENGGSLHGSFSGLVGGTSRLLVAA